MLNKFPLEGRSRDGLRNHNEHNNNNNDNNSNNNNSNTIINIIMIMTMIMIIIVAIFYPFSQFCEINISLLSLQKEPNTAPNLFQRGVENGKYDNNDNHRLGGESSVRPPRSPGKTTINQQYAQSTY